MRCTYCFRYHTDLMKMEQMPVSQAGSAVVHKTYFCFDCERTFIVPVVARVFDARERV